MKYNLFKKTVGPVLMLLLAVVSISSLPFCNTTSLQTFSISFVTKEGEPYPVNLILSNGIWRKEFTNVTYATTEVPTGVLTYTYVYDWPAHPSIMKQGEVLISLGESREFIAYVVDPTQIVPRTGAFIHLEEVGANASVSYEWDNISNTLTLSGYIEPSKFASVAVGIDNNIREAPNYVLSACASKQTWWVCAWIGWDKPFSTSFTNLSISFSEIDPGEVIVGFRRALYNNAIIDTAVNRFNSVLWDLEGRKIDMKFVYPQYAVLPGYYILQPLDVPEEYARIKLPLNVSLGKPIVLDYYPPKMAELEPFTFSVAAEYFFAKSSYSNFIHDEMNRKMTLDVSTKTMYDWWGYFVLPSTHKVKTLTEYSASESYDLNENYDYTINHVGSYNVIAVRISKAIERLTLVYELSVGGIVVPVDKFGLLAPYVGLASTILIATVATAIYVKRVKRRKEKQ